MLYFVSEHDDILIDGIFIATSPVEVLASASGYMYILCVHKSVVRIAVA